MKENRRQELIFWHLDQLANLLEEEEKKYNAIRCELVGISGLQRQRKVSLHFDEIVTQIANKITKGESS